MNNCVIIPARYNSKRLPGKPLIYLTENLLIGETIKNLKKKIYWNIGTFIFNRLLVLVLADNRAKKCSRAPRT